jgi:hypothetical protein
VFSRLFSVPIAYYGGNSTKRWITFGKIKKENMIILTRALCANRCNFEKQIYIVKLFRQFIFCHS